MLIHLGQSKGDSICFIYRGDPAMKRRGRFRFHVRRRKLARCHARLIRALGVPVAMPQMVPFRGTGAK